MMLGPLEIATGLVFGADESPAPLPEAASEAPLAALEREILPALLRPPCVVSFSGGRDSSAVLAVAARLARREGLPLPVPATNVLAGAPGAQETEWQTRVIDELGLDEWLRLRYTDELDVIGPFAQRVLRRHGLLWPCNLHFHLPLLEAAGDGSLLTGIGGDELFLATRHTRFSAIRTRTARPEPRDVLRMAFAFAPGSVRRSVISSREPIVLPWLRPGANRAAATANARETAAEPRRLRERLAWWQTLRYLQIGRADLDLLGRDHNVRVAHPLLSPRFWATVANEAPFGFASRTEGMRRLFGGLLPEDVIARRSKAHFDEAFWTRRAQRFAHTWTGAGVPEEYVDRGALARHWRSERPIAGSFTLLQTAWLHSQFEAQVRSDRERDVDPSGSLTRASHDPIVLGSRQTVG